MFPHNVDCASFDFNCKEEEAGSRKETPPWILQTLRCSDQKRPRAHRESGKN